MSLDAGQLIIKHCRQNKLSMRVIWLSQLDKTNRPCTARAAAELQDGQRNNEFDCLVSLNNIFQMLFFIHMPTINAAIAESMAQTCDIPEKGRIEFETAHLSLILITVC